MQARNFYIYIKIRFALNNYSIHIILTYNRIYIETYALSRTYIGRYGNYYIGLLLVE